MGPEVRGLLECSETGSSTATLRPMPRPQKPAQGSGSPRASMTIRAVVFDMDGVIADSVPFHLEAECATLRRFGLDLGHEEVDRYSGDTLYWKFERIIEDFGVNASVAEMAAAHFEHSYPHVQRNTVAMPGVIELIRDLHARGLALGVASGSPERYVAFVLERFGVRPLFGSVLTADDVARGKPDPESYLRSAENLGCEPAACIAIEDSAKGVEAAKRAGMICLALRNPNSGPQDLSRADVVFDAYAALARIPGLRREVAPRRT